MDSSEIVTSNALSLGKSDSEELDFPEFKELPMELRLKIWRLAVDNLPPRRFEITDHSFDFPSPSTFFVNHESREESKRVLSKLFDGETFIGTKHEVYFCPEKDTIAFKDFRNFKFPQDQLVQGPPDRSYRFPSQTECDSVKILEVEEDLGMWMYIAVNFGDLDRLILTGQWLGFAHHARAFGEAKKYYKQKLAHGNCTKIPEIIVRDRHGYQLKTASRKAGVR